MAAPNPKWPSSTQAYGHDSKEVGLRRVSDVLTDYAILTNK